MKTQHKPYVTPSVFVVPVENECPILCASSGNSGVTIRPGQADESISPMSAYDNKSIWSEDSSDE